MSSRLCAVCRTIISGPQHFRQERPHHQSAQDVLEAAMHGCYICGVITKSTGWKSLIDAGDPFRGIWYLSNPVVDFAPEWLKITIDAFPDDGRDENEDSEGDDTEVPGFELPVPPLWGFLLQPAEDVEENVSDYNPPAGSWDTPGFLDLPLQWLENCLSKHEKCREKKPGFYPTRVLRIISDEELKLVIVPEERGTIKDRYASLSHCWGKAKTLKLLQSNIDQLQHGIVIVDLPTSYREAIAVCRRFGIHYIWIDSLCIIQDSREDWEREALTMKDVYQNSILNVAAAAAAESSDASFLSRNPDFIRSLKVRVEWDHAVPAPEYYLVNEDLYTDDIKNSPLHQRSWVMQEVLLTTRNLSLTKNQLWFECSEFDACETYPNGVPPAWLAPDHRAQILGLDSGEDLAAIYRRWLQVVEKYAACFLTFPSDKMIALAGIAQHYQALLPGDEYLAGNWRSQLPQVLQWSTHKTRRCFRPDLYRSPSWSWTSVEGPVRAESEPLLAEEGSLSTPCTVLDVAVHIVDGHDTGFVSGGYIRLKGPLAEVGLINDSLSIEVSPGEWDYLVGYEEDAVDTFGAETWTTADLDEATPDGDPAVSYFHPLTDQACQEGLMEGLTRVREVLEGVILTEANSHRNWHLYALQILEFVQDGRKMREGSILLRKEEWPGDVYQRVGSFTVAGDVAVDALQERSSEQIITII
ncbi:heterokaryon incompatibility protein-domain-containing protein [Podospora australis]|uniref:Heterokaryon incompatibility protein-domain-containing protein n=1 Tax=Podospora australis TaxID=1536484 RepID=A0AAN7ACT4_9PEZI|nr:heterokaryon incompatibility protein-domain-containing protein [Podospora australis]